MPAITTHKIFAENVLKKLQLKQSINIDKNIYFTFAQSHDLLFYYKGFKHKLYNDLGHKSHHYNTQDFIINIISYIKRNNLTRNKECLSFLYGILTHYYLDSIAHPYIFYKTGTYKKDKKTLKYKGKHNELERQIDALVYELKYKKRYNDYNFKDSLKKYKTTKELKSLINYSYKTTYNIDNIYPKINKGIKTMRIFHKLIVYDKYSFKYKLFLLIDKIFKTNLHPYSTSIKYKTDILNIKKKKWHHPVTYKESHMSFIELMEKAESNYIKTINQIDKYFNNKSNLTILKTIIKDIDYSTGLIVKENKRMKYFEY